MQGALKSQGPLEPTKGRGGGPLETFSKGWRDTRRDVLGPLNLNNFRRVTAGRSKIVENSGEKTWRSTAADIPEGAATKAVRIVAWTPPPSNRKTPCPTRAVGEARGPPTALSTALWFKARLRPSQRRPRGPGTGATGAASTSGAGDPALGWQRRAPFECKGRCPSTPAKAGGLWKPFRGAGTPRVTTPRAC